MSLKIKLRTRKLLSGSKSLDFTFHPGNLFQVHLKKPIMLFKYNQAMAQIEVMRLRDFPEYQSEVIVRGDSITKHKVTIARDYYDQLTAGAVTPEELIEASFEFLLAHEPNTSILSEFDLAVISSYFPEYVQEMKRKFQS